MTKVKICGLKSLADVAIVNKYLPEYVGFVFADTKRKVSDELAREMKRQLDTRIQTVGVFVNEPKEHIVALCRQGVLDMVQLHGDEDKAYITALKREIQAPIMKAIRVQSTGQVKEELQNDADFWLFDTYKKGVYGGSGERFSLSFLQEILDTETMQRPFFIAGGLDAQNVREVLEQTACAGVDVSSGVETDGRKDEAKVREFIQRVHKKA